MRSVSCTSLGWNRNATIPMFWFLITTSHFKAVDWTRKLQLIVVACQILIWCVFCTLHFSDLCQNRKKRLEHFKSRSARVFLPTFFEVHWYLNLSKLEWHQLIETFSSIARQWRCLTEAVKRPEIKSLHGVMWENFFPNNIGGRDKIGGGTAAD